MVLANRASFFLLRNSFVLFRSSNIILKICMFILQILERDSSVGKATGVIPGSNKYK
jgi:hypothetical protein